jgi:bifunctional enzyme CysN/CysC
MATATNKPAMDIEEYLHIHQHKSFLRFITCGSVDDGKSTLIGRLLFDSKMIFEDQLAKLSSDSVTGGTLGGELDLSLLPDGLEEERQQKITIDVGYMFFSTEKRKFIVADTPGHEQYTRNMVTGASTADLAIILLDARKGVLTQTRRHSYLVSLLGIKNIVLAVNKMDLVDFSQKVFDDYVAQYKAFASQFNFTSIVTIPVSALKGDNITLPSPKTPWYTGPTLIGHLETIKIDDQTRTAPFRLPVQWVNRPNLDFRGFSGMIASGTVRPGDRLRVLPSGKESTVDRIVTYDGDLPEAIAGESITITLKDEIDISRGDILAHIDSLPEVADKFETTIVWMAEEPMATNRPYRMKIGTKMVTAKIIKVIHKINVNTLEFVPADGLALNEIGVCQLSLDQRIAFDPYIDNRDTGGFILIDRITNATLGAGLVRSALRKSHDIHWQATQVNKDARAAMKHQKPTVLWFTGLSGSGKSTIADQLERNLHASGHHTYLLDGDNIRHGLNKDLGFTSEDRVENIRRIAEVARLMVDAGLIVIVSFISPFKADRQLARELVAPGEFFEVFVDTPLEVAETRDPKGLYKKARRGELPNFTGISSPYEKPDAPEITVDTTRLLPHEAVEQIVDHLRKQDVLSPLADPEI